MEVYRNPNGNFELTVPLVAVDGSDDWVTGKAAELTNDTIKVMYHNATVWTTATFSGTVTEIASNGAYHIIILSSFFTNRNENYPIIIKIIDDAGTKTWKDTGVVIQGRLQLEKIDISRDSSLPAVKINNADGNAIDINSDNDIGINITANDQAIKAVSTLGPCVTLEATDGTVLDLVATAGRGILITSTLDCIELNSTTNETGIKMQRINITGSSSAPSVQIAGAGAVPTVSITSTNNKGLYISSNNIALELNSTNNEALKMVGGSNAVTISGPTGVSITGNTFQAISIVGQGTTSSLQITNTSTGKSLEIVSANGIAAVHLRNSSSGAGLYSQADGAGSGFKMTSSTGKNIEAAEIDNIGSSVSNIEGELPVVGPIASQGDVQALSNNTRYRVSIPSFAKIPSSDDIIVPVKFYFLDDTGMPYDPDSEELTCQIRATNQQSYKVVMFNDESGATPATINTTYTPSYYDLVKLAVGQYQTFVKIDNTETQDTWVFTFTFAESAQVISIPAQMYVTEEIVSITLDDSTTNRSIIAKSMKTEEVVDAPVTGSIYDDLKNDLDTIVAKLPSGNISGLELATIIDELSLEDTLAIIRAAVLGKYVLNSPTPGQMSVFKHNNSTLLYTVAITTTQRTRVTP